MTQPTDTPLAERIFDLMRHLGIERAHFAACMARDWAGFVSAHKSAVASLTLLCPMGIDLDALGANPPPVLVITGDQGRGAIEALREAKKIAGATTLVLPEYFSPPWADVTVAHGDAIGPALGRFVAGHGFGDSKHVTGGAAQTGHWAGITYDCRGSGEPLLLMPLALSPSQWRPLIEALSQKFCVITLGGAHLGMVAHLETRAQSSYMRVIDGLLNELKLEPGQSLLEVGCGPGAIVRRVAARSRGANPITGADVNSYLLGEAQALAKRDGLDGFIDFQLGDALALPFADNRFDRVISCTVMEEGDAGRMLGEFVRVCKPGGKVGGVTRAIDLPRWVNLPLSAALKAKVDSAALFGGNVTANGCADASLYRRMIGAGLLDVTMLPAWATHQNGERLEYLRERIVAQLSPVELSEWQAAYERGVADGTFFVSEPFHCAVGKKT